MTDYKTVFQLAKDKGCYSENRNSEMLDDELKELSSGWLGDSRVLINQMRLLIIQKWLREEKGIHLDIYNQEKFWQFDGYDFSDSGYIRADGTARKSPRSLFVDYEKHPTYEQALLEGIHEALKLI